MRILVTGAAGYIGSALVRALKGREVVSTDQSAPATIIGNLAYPQFARSLITPEIGLVYGWASAIIREPLAGRDYVCPVPLMPQVQYRPRRSAFREAFSSPQFR